LVKAVKFKGKDSDEHFVLASTTFSPIGVGTILERLDAYIEDVAVYSEEISMNNPNGGDLQSLYSITKIRDRSIEMLTGTELLKASLDRFVCADEDVARKRKHYAVRARWLRRRHGKRDKGRRDGVKPDSEHGILQDASDQSV
jgi:hypothetical protein